MSNSVAKPASGRVVVLGGLGFIGSHICRELTANNYAVRIFDKLYASRELVADYENQIEIVEGDANRAKDVLAAIRDATVLIDLIHTTVPGSSMKDPVYDISTNVVSTVRWLERLSETNIRRILFVSSGGAVYGVPRMNPITEEHPTNPTSSYGITKLAIEKYISMYASMCGIDYCLVRPSNVYGEGQRLNIGQGVIGVMVDRALRGEQLELWGSGKVSRDYLHVSDLAAAMIKLSEYRGSERVFNVSSGVGHSVLEIIAILENLLGPLPDVVRQPERSYDVPVNVLDSSKLHKETGWRPLVSLEEGIARTVAAMKTSLQR
ncbi:MAG TPA: NAD-dependent epimerase/dehydratase family protein [Pyrinomonadaceae bacterium]|jgi:UDP-glucose 4-epimerase